MQAELVQDLQLLKKRKLQLEEEGKMIEKQFKQIREVETSGHFYQLRVESQVGIVKGRTHKNKEELASMICEAKDELENERADATQLKEEILAAIVQKDELVKKKAELKLQLKALDDYEIDIRNEIDRSKQASRKELQNLIDVDVGLILTQALVSLHRAIKAGDKAAQKGLRHFKLTQMEFEEKYEGGLGRLVASVSEIIDNRQGKVNGTESRQRHMLEQLIARRKALKKAQDELELVKKMYAPRSEVNHATEDPIRQRTSGKKPEGDEHSHENTEVVFCLQRTRSTPTRRTMMRICLAEEMLIIQTEKDILKETSRKSMV